MKYFFLVFCPLLLLLYGGISAQDTDFFSDIDSLLDEYGTIDIAFVSASVVTSTTDTNYITFTVDLFGDILPAEVALAIGTLGTKTLTNWEAEMIVENPQYKRVRVSRLAVPKDTSTKLLLSLDPMSAREEQSEKNNAYELSVAAIQPDISLDLYIDAFAYIAATKKITVRVCTTERILTEPTVSALLRWGDMHLESTVRMKDLCQDVAFALKDLGITTKGTYTMTVEIGAGDIKETTIENNTVTKDIAISFPIIPIPPEPEKKEEDTDLYIGSATYNKDMDAIDVQLCWEPSSYEQITQIALIMDVAGKKVTEKHTNHLHTAGCKLYVFSVGNLKKGVYTAGLQILPVVPIHETDTDNNAGKLSFSIASSPDDITPVNKDKEQPWQDKELLLLAPHEKNESSGEVSFVASYELLAAYCQYTDERITSCTNQFGLSSLRTSIHELMSVLILYLDQKKLTIPEQLGMVVSYRKKINDLTSFYTSDRLEESVRFAFIFAYIDYSLALYQYHLERAEKLITMKRFFSNVGE